MSFAAETRVLMQRVVDLWSPPPALYFENEPRPDNPGDEWIAVFIMPAGDEQIYVSQPTYRYAGTVVAQCFVRANTGAQRLRAIADLFAALWLDPTTKLPLQLSDAQAGTFRFIGRASIGDSIQSDEWLQQNVVAFFQRDVTVT